MTVLKKVVRTAKSDSAYLYFILESYEGWTAYSTLPNQPGDTFRDIELVYTSDFRQEVDCLIERLGSEISVTILH